MDEHHLYIVILQIFGSVAIFCTSMMLWNLLSLYIFNKEGHFAMGYVYSILAGTVFGDLFINWGYLTQYRPPSDTALCDAEGWSLIFGSPTTWLWTLQLAYVLFSIAVWEKMPNRFWRSNFVSWGIPFIFACFQFVCGGFGLHDEDTYDICCERKNDSVSFVYHMITFYGLFIVVVFLLLIMLAVVQYLQWKRDPRTLSHLFLLVQQSLQFYPMLLLICWVPYAVIRIFDISVSPLLFLCALLLKNSHGVVVPIVYFYQSPQARKYFWKSVSPSQWKASSQSLRWSFLSINTSIQRSSLLPSSFRRSTQTRETLSVREAPRSDGNTGSNQSRSDLQSTFSEDIL